MKILVASVLLLSTAMPSLCQCGDTTIKSSDTIGSVKAKLACLASELAKVKTENMALKAENDGLKNKATVPLMTWQGANRTDKLPIGLCKSKATDVVLDRGGTVTGHGGTWVSFTIGDKDVVVECNSSFTAYVFVAGHDLRENSDLSALLTGSIFPRSDE